MRYHRRPRLRSYPPTSEASLAARVSAGGLLQPSCRHARPWPRSACARTSAGVAVGLDLVPGVGDRAVGIDQERRALDAHVLPAVVLLERPGAVGRRDRVILVRQQGERQVELLAEAAVAVGAVRADPPDVGALGPGSARRGRGTGRPRSCSRRCRPRGRSRRPSSGRAGRPAGGSPPCSSGRATSGARSPAIGHAHGSEPSRVVSITSRSAAAELDPRRPAGVRRAGPRSTGRARTRPAGSPRPAASAGRRS